MFLILDVFYVNQDKPNKREVSFLRTNQTIIDCRFVSNIKRVANKSNNEASFKTYDILYKERDFIFQQYELLNECNFGKNVIMK